MTPREEFENAIIIKLNIPENVFLLKEIQDKTKIIQDHQFSEFISRLSAHIEFHTKDEKLDAVVAEFKDELRSKLFEPVEADAKLLNTKLEIRFRQVEDWYSPNNANYSEELVARYETPRKYIQEAKTLVGEFWTKADVYIIESVGIGLMYSIYNDSYRSLTDRIAQEMKSAITKKYLIGDTKQLKQAMGKIEIKRIGK